MMRFYGLHTLRIVPISRLSRYRYLRDTFGLVWLDRDICSSMCFVSMATSIRFHHPLHAKTVEVLRWPTIGDYTLVIIWWQRLQLTLSLIHVQRTILSGLNVCHTRFAEDDCPHVVPRCYHRSLEVGDPIPHHSRSMLVR